MKKVIDLGAPFFSERMDIWKTKLGLELEVLTFNKPEGEEFAESQLQEADWVFMPFSENLSHFSSLKQQKEVVREVGFFDVLVRHQESNKQRYWADVYLVESLYRAIVRKNKTLDISKIAYIAGMSPLMQPCLLALTELGFTRIQWVLNDSEIFENTKTKMLKRLFNVQLSRITDSELTMQPNDGSLLVNCVGAQDPTSVVEDLSYLNFIRRDGLVVDLSNEQNQLHVECVNAEQPLLELRHVMAVWDQVFFEAQEGVLSKEQLTRENFEKAYQEFTQSRP